MLNSKPNNANYHQGLYIPENIHKTIQLNEKGGFWYRSMLEKKAMIYFDNSPDVLLWSSEPLRIPYVKNTWDDEKNVYVSKTHGYYPDFYYETVGGRKVIAEVKPVSETKMPSALNEKATAKQRKNFDYALKTFEKNMYKWTYAKEFCDKNGIEFKIITDEFLN